MIQSVAVATEREEDQAAAAPKPKDESEEEDLVIATIQDGPIFDSSEKCKLLADERILKDLEQHPAKTGMPRSSALMLNNTDMPSSTVEANTTVFVLKSPVFDSEVYSAYK